jgi:cysteine synthase
VHCNNILDAIGHTPLVRLNRLTTGFDAEVYVKADYMNPGGSVKDRIGKWMIDDAERRGIPELASHSWARCAVTSWSSPLPTSNRRKKWTC